MVLIVCLDDKNGMSFNRRRQSRDLILCERILSIVGDSKVYMMPYSAKIFPADNAAICPCENLASIADSSGFYFAEIDDPEDLLGIADEVIVYRWNRTYPADRYFPMEILQDHWTLVRKNDFPGNSHPQITEEVYRK